MHSPGNPCDRVRASTALRLHEPRPGEEQAHLEACAACRVWLERRLSALDLVRSLPRRAPSEALDERVRSEIEGARTPPVEVLGADPRLATALRSLARRSVPAILDDRVFDGCRADTSRLASRLRRLPRHRTPRVLARLLDEELRSPSAHRARRFAGDLERLSVPGDLEERVRRVQERKASRLPWVGVSLTGLVAAALVFWIAHPTSLAGDTPYRFRVARASSVSELSPYAQWFANGITGGALGMVAREGEER